MNNILVPLDGSDFSAQVLPALKKHFDPHNSTLILYSVGARPDGFTGTPSRPATVEVQMPYYESQQDIELARHPIYESQEEDSLVSALTDQFSSLASSLRADGFTVKVEGEFGHPAEAIIERVRAGDVDLVAMTTHGRSGISRLIFGSVAEQVVRHVSVPVLLVRPVSGENETSSSK